VSRRQPQKFQTIASGLRNPAQTMRSVCLRAF
jgi:hypothetical protein